MSADEQTGAADWRRVGVATVALVAMVALVLTVWLVASSSKMRDQAVQREREAYDVTLLTRTIDASISRSEAALGRFVLDEEIESGQLYQDSWRLARQQLNQLYRLTRSDEAQAQRVAVLIDLFRAREAELDAAARAAASQQREGGINLFYASGRSQTGPLLRRQMQDIAAAERDALVTSIDETRIFSARANRLSDYLIALGVLAGTMAVLLGGFASEVFRQYARTRRQAETETERASLLEDAVAARTIELQSANEALRAEAEERASAEAQLRQAQKMEAVGQLTGGIAHDFNNMLAVVVGGLDLAKRRIEGPQEEVLNHLANAMDGATRAAALTRRLLSFARSEPLLPETVDPANMIEAMRELLDRSLGERITIRYNVAERGWSVFVDPHQLENALLNLALNARDAMAGEGDLLIEYSDVALGADEIAGVAPGDYVRIAVSDSGVGMTEEVRERAFEPFFTTKEVGKGTGLGLSQIFGFARQSGGGIGIDSTPGEGTTVAIYLPRSEAHSANVHLHPAATAPVGGEADDFVCADARILVVEDDVRVRTATMGALEELGYAAEDCSSGAEALDRFEPGKYDLVISDVIMPEMTGPEMVRELKKKQPDVAVLFVTGYVGDGDNEELKGYELLRKPFTVGGLSRAVADTLRRSPVRETRSAAIGG